MRVLNVNAHSSGNGATLVRRRRIPPVPDLALRLKLDGDMGMISPAGQGWKLHSGHLVPPEGVEWICGQIQAWEFERQLLAQFKRERMVPLQLAFPKP